MEKDTRLTEFRNFLKLLHKKDGIKTTDKTIEDLASGYTPAIFTLGLFYYNGELVQRDQKRGRDLIGRAANDGHEPAIEWLRENPESKTTTKA